MRYIHILLIQRTVKELSMDWYSGLLQVILYIFDSFETVVFEAQRPQKNEEIAFSIKLPLKNFFI